MHHRAKRVLELEWDKELDGLCNELLQLAITYQSDGSYFITVIYYSYKCVKLFEFTSIFVSDKRSENSDISISLNGQIEDSNSPALDVKAVHIGNNFFRVEAGGLHMNVTLASYSKVCLSNITLLLIRSFLFS